jgi:RimJ/RimL family protein N-acetyltransferase
MKTPFLVGTSIYLRPLNREDALVLQQHMNHPDVNRTIAMWRPMSLEREQEWIESTSRGENTVVFGIALREDDRLIGGAGLHEIDWRNRSASFGIQIGDPAEWKKGYGTEATKLVTGYAFDRLNLNRVWLYVYAHNPGGVRAYEKVGYCREGVLRQAVFRDGAYGDVYLMAILAEEWRAAHPQA